MIKGKEQPLVSICIPVYNCEEFIVSTIQSCLNQTYKNIEIIISDNASTDNTVTLINNIIDSRIILLNNKTNQGAIKNFNKAIHAAKGKYVKLLPADDLLLDSIIEKQVEVFENNLTNDIVLVTCRKFIIDEKGNGNIIRGIRLEGCIEGKDAVKKIVRYGANPYGEPGAVLIRTDVSKKVSFNLSNSFAADIYFYCNVLKYGNLYCIKEPLCKFRIPTNSLSLQSRYKHHKYFVEFIEKVKSSDDNYFEITTMDTIIGRFMSVINFCMRNIFYLYNDLKMKKNTK